MANLEKVTAEFNKKKERMEKSKAQYEADYKIFKLAEEKLTEAENLEIVKLIREVNLTIPELREFREKMKTQLPNAAVFEKKEEHHESENFKETD